MFYSTRSLSLSHHHEGQSSGMLGCPDLQPRRDVCLSELGTLEEVIGRGETSNIFSCTFEGKRAALKTIRVDIVNPLKISEVNEMLRKERDLLESLHGHPYIVRLLGSGTAGTLDEPRVFLVLERLVCNLSQALGTNKHKTALQRMWQKRNMPKRRAVTLMLQTAVALSFLHCGGCNTGQGLIIHRDVKPSNIGLDQSGCARLMDFGLCQFIPAGVAGSAEVYCLTGVTGSLRYMAPEVANCEEYCESADVYSWAVVFAEALNLRKPFEGIESVQFKRGLTSNEGLRPELTSKKVSKGLRSLLEECWARDPVSRPTFEQVVPRLTTLLERDFPVSPCVRECLL
jgi:serine/threonine protein kinase